MQEKTDGGFKPGDKVTITCYHHGCEKIAVEATLGTLYGRAEGIETWGPGMGRLAWPAGSTYQLFELSELAGGSGVCRCPNCQISFVDVIAIFPPEGEPILFGYEAEGC